MNISVTIIENVKSNWEFCSTFISLIEIVEHKKHKFSFILLSFVLFKGAVTDMRYFGWSKFSASLVHKKNFSLICQVVFKLRYVFCQER